MKRTVHQSIAANTDAIFAAAVRFSVVLSAGRRREQRDFTKFADAVTHARSITAPYGQRAMIYAVTANDRAAHIPEDSWNDRLKF